ncbi:hypothetical protein G7046_g10154 [Stylonectria norvegica]|nr:hypothetical protein G7046_g10154 [Stylonectria norvegica]
MDPEVVKILLVGDEKCGKTTFLSSPLSRHIRRLSAGENVNPVPLLRDMDQPYNFDIKIKGKPYRFEFFDTSCPDNWRLLDPDVITICYDISQRLSLINAQRYVSPVPMGMGRVAHSPRVVSSKTRLTNGTEQWINEVKTSFERIDTLPLIILGLKRDLRSEKDPNGIIYPQEAYQMAQTLRADRYVECSALTGDLLKMAFEDLCKTALKSTMEQGGLSTESGCSVM